MAQEPWGLACEAAQQGRGACREPSGPSHHEKPQPPQSLAPGLTLHQETFTPITPGPGCSAMRRTLACA